MDDLLNSANESVFDAEYNIRDINEYTDKSDYFRALKILGDDFVLFNNNNCKMFIDDNQVSFQKKFKKGIKGIHKVKVILIGANTLTSMKRMFYDCTSLISLNLSKFNTSFVESMEEMLFGCCFLTSLNLNNVKTNNVKSMECMFYDCRFTYLDLNSFDTTLVTSMKGMFAHCINLKSLKISHFITSNITNMEAMLYGCISLKDLDLFNLVPLKNVNRKGMLSECRSLNDNLIDFDFVNDKQLNEEVTDKNYSFVKKIDIKHHDVKQENNECIIL